MSGPRVDVIAVGEALALLDPTRSGPLEDVSSFSLRTAGAEMNALIGLARLGHSAALVSAVGADPFGRLIVRTLAEEGVDTTHVQIGRLPTGVFFKERLGAHGRRVHYYRTGSAASALPASAAIGALDALPPRVVLASGLTLGLGDPDGLGSAAAAFVHEAHHRGLAVVFDANLRPGIWDGADARAQFGEICPSVDFLLAGDDELESLFPGGEVDGVASELLARGIRAVVVKSGRTGSTVYSPAGRTPVVARPVDAVDAIGAGDAFAAGFVSGLLRGWSPERAARLGSAMGAHAVTGTGDWESLPRNDSARALVASIEEDHA